MAERQGFMIYHEDANMLLSIDDPTIGIFFRNLSEFSMRLDETGEAPQETPFQGMTKGLYLSMCNKIIRDKKRYDNTVIENKIKGLISAVKREYKSQGKKVSDQEARQIAEERYIASVNNGQPQSTAVDNGELTVAKRSVAETVSETETVTQSVAGAQAKAESKKTYEWEDVKRVATEKGISTSNVHVLVCLNEQKSKTSCAELIERLNTDEAFVKDLRGFQ